MFGLLKPPVPTFEERAPHEVGFAKIFQEHVVPKLAGLESSRRQTQLAMLVIFALGGLFVWFCIEQEWAFAAKIGAFGTIGLPWIPAAMFWAQEERQIMSGVVRHFDGMTCWVNTQIAEERLRPYRRLDLLPAPQSPTLLNLGTLWEKVRLEEEINASHRDVRIWLGEGEILEKQAGEEKQLFYGTLLEFVLPVRPDVAYTMDPEHKHAHDGKPVVLLATEAVHATLQKLGEMLRSDSMKCDVADGVVYAAMPHVLRARPLSVGGIFQSAYRCEPMIRITLAQLAQLYAVADALADACGAPAAEVKQPA
jgi:hypothetical protein